MVNMKVLPAWFFPQMTKPTNRTSEAHQLTCYIWFLNLFYSYKNQKFLQVFTKCYMPDFFWKYDSDNNILVPDSGPLFAPDGFITV